MTDHITYEELLKICSEYSGHRIDSPGNRRFAQRTMERTFYRGKHGSLVSISMCSTAGCITLPEEVEYVAKAKINGTTRSVMSHWWNFSSARSCDFHTDSAGIQHLPDKYFTQYDAPWDYFIPVVKSRDGKESPEASITVQGISLNNEKVFLRHRGTMKSGQMLPLLDKKYVQGNVPFKRITGIEKTITRGYVDLFAKNPETNELVYMSGYSPRETRPTYTRIKVFGCPTETAHVELLARLKILSNYENNELIPLIGLDVLESICQELRLQKTNDFQGAQAAGSMAKELIRDENNYKYGNNDDALDVVDMGFDENIEVW